MQLTLTFSDGTTATVPFDTASTLQVSTDDAILGTWTSVASLALEDDPIEVVDGPAQVVLDPTAGVVSPPADVTPDPTSSDQPDGTVAEVPDGHPDGAPVAPVLTGDSVQGDVVSIPDPTSDAPVDAPEPTDSTPVDTPTPDSVGAALAAADAQNVADAAAAAVPDEAPAPQADTPAPDEAVAAVNDAIDTAVAGAHPDPDAHLTNSIALVDDLLVAYPDDVRLQDARQQLADLAADLSAETA